MSYLIPHLSRWSERRECLYRLQALCNSRACNYSVVVSRACNYSVVVSRASNYSVVVSRARNYSVVVSVFRTSLAINYPNCQN